MSRKLEEYELLEPMGLSRCVRIGTTRTTINDFAPDIRAILPDIPSEELYLFPGDISNQSIDSYFTRMAESSLINYAKDAAEGVAFVNSHRHCELPFGHSYTGQLNAGENPSVSSDFYTIRGLDLNGVNTDQLIRGIEARIVRDLSIGFKEGEGFDYICSVCGLSMWDWDCIHIPGAQYSVVDNPDADPKFQTSHMETCTAWVENARLSEVSAVFDGATPGAMLTKATREQRGGRLKPDVQRMLERSYRIQLPDKNRSFVPVPGGDTNKSEVEIMAGLETSGAPDIFDAEMRLEARTVGVDVAETDDAKATVRKMRQEIERLRPFEAQANDGKVLRAALVEETLTEGVRAFGNEFNRESKGVMLGNIPVDAVRELRDSWRQTADTVLANTKRISKDEADDKDGDDADTDTNRSSGDYIPDEAVGGV